MIRHELFSQQFFILPVMLRLHSITIVQFRNYLQQKFDFSERIVGICGLNGTGKTNLLDAIYYLSFSRSYFSRPDSQNVHHGLAGLRLEGRYGLNGNQHELTCVVRENNRKELTLNGEAYKRFSDHIGRFPSVMIAPDDVELITGSSEERRKFIDTLLSQVNAQYLQHLIAYNRIMQQRNSLLKQYADAGKPDESLLDILDEQLSERGNYIFTERKQFLHSFLPMVHSIYNRIAGREDALALAYESQLLASGDLSGLLLQARSKDLLLQRTTRGIHRDDLIFRMQDHPFRSEASQGQRKSLLFALKLAEWQFLKEQKGFTPILLLDDVFEKLDEQRMSQLLQWVCTESDGHVFITDTHPERLRAQLDGLTSYQLIELEQTGQAPA
ncbi:DNA replication/repair protein RecF [Sediminibacterium ginsengisoli]|uniref:DNA replication and repair protein RecF n=1 Tax=Sediminibacterium ginsengisoli TaxID=413434 RepID=A0A1T4R2X8_9BACT|nr:DNA replication and repair protein RecF [Sediminibacterium ginsengisoli]SKA10390.1 DNA replication and repair protein RecF [Sediminibacterium ginsengisoli]